MLEYLDWILIAAYFIVVFLVAFWSSFSKKRKSKDSSDYFLAGRNVGWFIIGASLFASNIGSEQAPQVVLLLDNLKFSLH
jgi:SSS family solute:Na+ symporter